MTNQNEVSQRIIQTRKELNLAKKDFAKRLGISEASLSNIENGKSKPGFDFLVNITKEFNVNLYYILFGEGEMFIPPVASSYARVSKFAVNDEDVRLFLYHFERSAILQYYILSQYKSKMLTESDLILKEIKLNEEE